MVMADPKPNDARNVSRLIHYVDSMHIGGILFSKGSPVPQARLTNRLQAKSNIPLMIALDGEWGLSMRLTGTTRFPRNMMLGAISDDSLIYKYGVEVGKQCRIMGIHINFAPSLDVNSNYANPVIGTRSFGEQPADVARKGLAYAGGLESEGIISVAKHFPGHGDTSEDSHYTLPIVKHSRQRIDSIELYPFRQYIDTGFAGIMTGHLQVPAIDPTPNTPTSLSKKTVSGLLIGKYGFRGLIFTDALAMRGAGRNRTTNPAHNPSVRALLAGNDVLLAPSSPSTDFKAVKEAIDLGILDMKDIEERCLKILRYKYIMGLNNYKPISLKQLEERINSKQAKELAEKLNSEGLTLLKNDSILPLHLSGKKRIAVLSLGEPLDNEFISTLSCYDSIGVFSLMRNATVAQRQKVFNKLSAFDTIVCGLHTVRIPESEQIRKLAEKKKVILVFFTQPYFTLDYKATIKNARAVVMAYEGSPLAQEYAAHLLFGGIESVGKLPVNIPKMYSEGDGLNLQRIRPIKVCTDISK
jgi:beta-glucosidase-like glycosyl hydrolase